MYADVWDDIIEISDSDDNVVTTFPTEGRTLDEVANFLAELYDPLNPPAITDWRGAQP